MTTAALSAQRRPIGDADAVLARFAAGLVPPRACVFLDGSPMAAALARQLARRPSARLTIVTNSAALAGEAPAGAPRLVLCPGDLDQRSRSTGGPLAVRFVRRLTFDVAFASVTLEPEPALPAPDLDVVRAALARSRRTFGLAGGRGLPARDVHAVLAGSAPPPRMADGLRRAGVRLEIAAPDCPQSSSSPHRNFAAPAAILMPPSTCRSSSGSSQ